QMYVKFLESRQTAVLSFVGKDGKPFSSTTPFVKKDDKLYIYISQIAEHYQLTENSEVVDVLLRADESKTKNPFATERVRFSCTPKIFAMPGLKRFLSLLRYSLVRS